MIRPNHKNLRLVFSAILVTIVALVASGAPVAVQAQGGYGYGYPTTYVVQPGDTLFSIASRYNVSLSELATINGLYDVNQVYVGQVLRMPSPLPGTGNPTPPQQPPVVYPYYPPQPYYPPGTTVTTVTTYRRYVVRKGDTLSAVAVCYNTTVAALVAANPGINPNYIYYGQVLNIATVRTTVVPAPRPRQTVYRRVYIVQPGDNLFGIAARFGRDVYAVAKANGLLNLNYIFVGQALVIP